MEQFTRFNWSNVISTNGDKSHRSPTTIDELDLVSATAPVNVYDGPHIATVELFMWRIAIQYDERMFGNH
jgi:hypothetical protein